MRRETDDEPHERLNRHADVLGYTRDEVVTQFPRIEASDVRCCYVTVYRDRVWSWLGLYRDRVHLLLTMEDDGDARRSLVVMLACPTADLERALHPACWWWLMDENDRRYTEPPDRPYWFEPFLANPVRQQRVVGWYYVYY